MTQRTPSLQTRVLALIGAAVLLASAACLGGSTAETAPKKERLCTPGNYVFCRCQDRSEGSKLCNDDGMSFGACEPCGEFGEDDPPFVPEPEEDGGVVVPAPECGNGIVELGEDCDDVNADDTDGCSVNCKLAGADPLSSRSCPGMPVHVWATPSVAYVGTTIGAPVATSVAPSCPVGGNPTTGNAGAERIFAVTAHQTGTLRVTTSDTSFNNFLYVMATCATGSSNPYLACVNAKGDSPDGGSFASGETLAFPVTAGVTYHLFVDGSGISNTQGPFRLSFVYE